jgi:hypothetical protein
MAGLPQKVREFIERENASGPENAPSAEESAPAPIRYSQYRYMCQNSVTLSSVKCHIGYFILYEPSLRAQRSNPDALAGAWIAALRSQ